jgi:hypothetical protein
MRPLHFYLVVYFALVLGAGFALWQAGVLRHIPVLWLVAGFGAAAALGVLLKVTALPARTRE